MSYEISNTDCIVCYCRPKTIKNNQIELSAFLIRPHENYLSVNWMPKETNTNIGLEQIKSTLEQKIQVKEGGRFVIFNIGVIKSYVYKFTGTKISILHKITSNDPTHAGILPVDVSKTNNKQKISHDIARTLSGFTKKHPNTVYPVYDDKKSA